MLPNSFNPELLRQLQLLKLQARRSFLGSKQGGHLSLRRGHGIEFADYRKYEVGDNPRDIDWAVYARSDRLYIKRFQEEQDLTVLIVLDCSASMGTPAKERKWERARDLALAVAYVSLMQQDTVLFSALGKMHSPHCFGARAIHNLSKLVVDIRPAGDLDLVREVQLAASRVRFPGIAIFVSDFLMPLSDIFGAFDALRAKNLDISAIQVLSDSDLAPWLNATQATFVDSESGEEMTLLLDNNGQEQYQRILKRHNQELLQYLLDVQISYSQTVASQEFDQSIIDCLVESGLLK